jgi:UDP-N-acetylglucosamine 2-epimerase (non-hydrolysing)/GDP/UDP-N,N'-diacetylbacillosamine 2-epimerase (hydrolysing)
VESNVVSRTVAVVTTSRADYSHLRWVLHELAAHPALEPRLIVSGAHLACSFGSAVEEIERDGLAVAERVECLIDADSDVGMAKTIGVATLGLADVLGRMRPDLLLLIADRYELLAPAAVALALRIPLAHIEGGEVSQGAIDDAVRHAVTKLAHVHFTPTETARRRVIGLGEEPWRVHRSGAPSLDHLRRSTLLDGAALAAALGGPVEPGTIVVAYHPVTLARDTLEELAALQAALERVAQPLAFCFPNADAGSRELAARLRALAEQRGRDRFFVNLNPIVYWSLLRESAALVGNSSSGLMETPSLALPTVNVGRRQDGRERARNVLDAPADPRAILDALARALDPDFRASLAGMTSPYGDGRAAERIAAVLATIPLGETLLRKQPPQPVAAEVEG